MRQKLNPDRINADKTHWDGLLSFAMPIRQLHYAVHSGKLQKVSEGDRIDLLKQFSGIVQQQIRKQCDGKSNQSFILRVQREDHTDDHRLRRVPSIFI